MKQQVSLYSFNDDIENLWLNSNRMLNMAFAFIGLLAVITSTVIWQNISDKKELKSIEEQISNSFNRANVANKKLDAALGTLKEKAIYEKYKAEYDSKVIQLEMLKSNGIVQNFKLGNFIDGLAYNTVPGLWLTKLDITNYGASIILTGRTVHMKLVPMLLTKLENNKVFSDKISSNYLVEADSKTAQQTFEINIAQSID